MALSKKEIKLIVQYNEKGANPILTAKLLKRDHRVILDTLETNGITGPWPDIPKTRAPEALRTRVRSILTQRTLLSAIDAVETLQGPDSGLTSDSVNLLIQTLIEEREKLAPSRA